MCNDLFITFYSLKHVFFLLLQLKIVQWQPGVVILSFSVQDELLDTQLTLLSHSMLYHVTSLLSSLGPHPFLFS